MHRHRRCRENFELCCGQAASRMRKIQKHRPFLLRGWGLRRSDNAHLLGGSEYITSDCRTMASFSFAFPKNALSKCPFYCGAVQRRPNDRRPLKLYPGIRHPEDLSTETNYSPAKAQLRQALQANAEPISTGIPEQYYFSLKVALR